MQPGRYEACCGQEAGCRIATLGKRGCQSLVAGCHLLWLGCSLLVPALQARVHAAAAAASTSLAFSPPVLLCASFTSAVQRLAYVYKAKTEKKGSKYRVIWGKVRPGL